MKAIIYNKCESSCYNHF